MLNSCVLAKEMFYDTKCLSFLLAEFVLGPVKELYSLSFQGLWSWTSLDGVHSISLKNPIAVSNYLWEVRKIQLIFPGKLISFNLIYDIQTLPYFSVKPIAPLYFDAFQKPFLNHTVRIISRNYFMCSFQRKPNA